MEDKQKTIAFTARVTPEMKTYLNELAWQNRMTISNYLMKIIKEDMEKHPDWRKTLDELTED